MRIVGGRLRGRHLATPADRAIRPTGDRTREAIFNILAHGEDMPDLDGATVLDAFCGTGALALEALSRGAAYAFLMDEAASSLALARRNVTELGEAAHATLIRGNATRPPPAPAAATVAFLDPPYGKDLAAPALAALAAAGWLAPGAVAVVEVAAGDPLALPAGFALLDERRYGDTRVVFARYA